MFTRDGIVNAALFQLNWFACVAWGAIGQPWWALATLSALLLFVIRRPLLKPDLTLALGFAFVGLLLDSVWIRIGVLDFDGAALAPVWIVMMWIGAALTINHSLSIFLDRPLLGGALAACSAPLCYLGGERLGGVTVTSEHGLALIALAWLVVFGVTFGCARRIERWRGHQWLGTVFTNKGKAEEV